MKSINPRFTTLLIAGVLGGVTAAPVLAAPAPADFKRYDSNGDGRISLEEYRAHGGKPRAFHDGDTNHDNSLSEEEFVKAVAIDDRIKLGKYADDAWITAKVKASLLKDEGLKGLDVNVETHKATVQLAGWVDTPMQIAEAEKIARSVEGVKAIQNDLHVKR